MERNSFLLLGGDSRMEELAKLLLAEGARVAMVGFGDKLPEGVRLPEAGERFSHFVGPTPGSREGKFWNTPMVPGTLPLAENWPGCCESVWFFGKPDGFEGTDLMEDEYFLEKNAALTAEGMLRILLTAEETAPSGERILILGYGRIGKHLSRMLRALGADVTVTLRKELDRAFAAAQGQNWVEFDGMEAVLPMATVIINTVPHLPEGSLKADMIRSNVRLYDLAPGSLKGACSGLPILDLPGIPGRFYPASAAAIQYRTLKKAIACQRKKEGVSWT